MKPSVIIALIGALATVIVAVIQFGMPSRQKPMPTVAVPPTALESKLSKANIRLTEIPGKEEQVRQWLLADAQYQMMAQTILSTLAGSRVVSLIPLDVITAKYRVELGGGPGDNFPPEAYQDIEKAKVAMFETWKERNPTFPQKFFDEIVEGVK